MAFKKLLASLGAGGASVETVLHEVNVVPGGVVQGEVRIQGGSVNQDIEGLLRARPPAHAPPSTAPGASG